MSLKSFFSENNSLCRGGLCARDAACQDKLCEGHPGCALGVESALPVQYAEDDGMPDEYVDWAEAMIRAALIAVCLLALIAALSPAFF